MARRKKDPLRVLSDEERRSLIQLRRASNAPAVQVARATMILAVADGEDYQSAAKAAGRKSGDAVSHLVARFNREGLAALTLRHAGGRVSIYDETAKKRILREFARTPTPETDGTATWSLATLRRALRSASDGLPRVSTYTILQVLHEAGFTFQRSRTWCSTGAVLRKRKRGTAIVVDPDADVKKS
ncbi:MAG TPA: helix-turn-helix domain-containing protein [Pirellulales bacterium]